MGTAGRPSALRDVAHMRRALSLARQGWGRTAPNPLVGAVVVQGDTVVGEGFHAEYGGPHAEAAALQAAGEGARGATVYVTLEPCRHHGKTPPCADALIAGRVRRVVAAVDDPNPTAAGGAARLRAAGVEVEIGVERGAACELNAAYFNAFRSPRPWVTLKLAISRDGAITNAARSVAWFTGPESRLEVHRLRAGHDAVAVGLGTVLADDPALTVREGPAPRVAPARVVFDDAARLPPGTVLARTARQTPTVVLARTAASTGDGAAAEEPLDALHDRVASLEECGVRVITAASVEAGLESLRREGVRSVLVEGGARVAGTLLERALVDRLIIFQSPIVLGAGALDAFAHAPGMSLADVTRYPVVEQRTFGDDTMTVYALNPAPCSPA
jgi:diaminohydroxyphosphoribosylaminopyrimidine deaminase/5-amino-6-(5-phosphoribosylamino)uracil reductase